MTTAESQIDPLIPDMSQLFPWQNPQTRLNTALPWIENVVTSVLSFVPFVGSLFGLAGKGSEFASGVRQSASAFADGGLQELQQDPT